MSSPPPWRVVDAAVAPVDRDDGPAGSERAIPLAAIVAGGVALVLATAGVAIVLAGYAGGDVPSVDASLAVDGPGPVVEVAGAVSRPGVYTLRSGARVADAIEAAGGFGPRVSAERVAAELTLSAPVADGARLVVPSRDDPVSSEEPVDGRKPIDLNRASPEELDTLPGIGPVTAAKIVDARKEQPFHAVDELRSRGILGQKAFDRIRDLVTVR